MDQLWRVAFIPHILRSGPIFTRWLRYCAYDQRNYNTRWRKNLETGPDPCVSLVCLAPNQKDRKKKQSTDPWRVNLEAKGPQSVPDDIGGRRLGHLAPSSAARLSTILLKGHCRGDKKVFGEICATIRLFVAGLTGGKTSWRWTSPV